MIKLTFMTQREIMNFVIYKKYVFYSDRKFSANNLIRVLPRPELFIAKARESRNAIPKFIVQMFTFSENDIKEYEQAKDEEELAVIIERDAKMKGCRKLGRVNVKEEDVTDELKKALETAEVINK